MDVDSGGYSRKQGKERITYPKGAVAPMQVYEKKGYATRTP